MFKRILSVPLGYAERGCLLVSYSLPLLPHCFVLCHDEDGPSPQQDKAELLSFFIGEAERLAHEFAGNPDAFLLIHSGAAVRKRSNWHLHVFIVRHRWQKAWVYMVLSVKNASLALWHALTGARAASPGVQVK
ncbi:hypothetical protein ACSFA7_29370 [Variovorax sp. LT1R20]|uniref:hypothetical protein n=1 Tax=Variovorax sp. LT1R20 TaxID=3443729 RepID=UPI003F47FE3A